MSNTRRALLLDLFCGAGGCAVGYHRAGFDVRGVDIAPQDNYPFEFTQGSAFDALEAVLSDDIVVDAIHASPPCQAYSALHGLTTKHYPALIDGLRIMLQQSGVPYVIENVVGAPLINPIRLCGSSFGLRVWRHRLFEMSHNTPALVPSCSHHHHPLPIDVTGTGGPSGKPRTSPGGGLSRKPASLGEAREAMGIDWMSRAELSEAVPPAYTEFVGGYLMNALTLDAAA